MKEQMQVQKFRSFDNRTRQFLIDLAELTPARVSLYPRKIYPQEYAIKPIRLVYSVCKSLNVTVPELSSNSRKRELVYARTIIMYILRTNKYEFKRIAGLFDLNHCNAVVACDRHVDLMETKCAEYMHKYALVTRQIRDCKILKEDKAA